ncbi:MAG: site-specific integrase [gamma proteobacterium symbiont of Clathrolucina costata]
MGSVRERKESGLLFFDFRYRCLRCREQTLLEANAANRRKAQKILDRIEREIFEGTFVYAKYFPGSRQLAKFKDEPSESQITETDKLLVVSRPRTDALRTPNLESFSDLWYSENEVAWRRTHRKTVGDILKKHLKPAFGEVEVGSITKAEIMAFRSKLAKVPGRKGSALSPKRINAIMGLLRQILNEAADRFDFITPYQNIKPLRVPKSDVQPFTLEEVNRIISHVRSDYRNYYTVRFFTGMRTGEIDGLKWKYVDFANRLILIRQTIVAGKEDYTKTDGSQREIQMSQVVFEALQAQEKETGHMSDYVFCTREGQPLDHNNVTKRVWYPLLRHLDLTPRRPYQSRHTAATLWLASGENPEWIARQMGHSTTEMLFKVYSRFIPNLTRQDGSAFERMLARQSVGVNGGVS